MVGHLYVAVGGEVGPFIKNRVAMFVMDGLALIPKLTEAAVFVLASLLAVHAPGKLLDRALFLDDENRAIPINQGPQTFFPFRS